MGTVGTRKEAPERLTLKVDEEFWALEVPRRDPDVVLCPGVVKLCESPIDQAEFALLVVDHDVVRFHVAVHDAARVAEVEGLEEFKDVVPDVVVGQARVEDFEIRIVDVFKHQTRRLALRAIVRVSTVS